MPKTLNWYSRAVRRAVHDPKMEMLNEGDLIEFVNEARRQVAKRAQCVRFLTPSYGSVVSATILNPGAGYTNPVVTITPPDFPSGQGPYAAGAQASATAQQIGGQITEISIDFGGYGYFQPQIFITDPTGTGCAATLSVANPNIATYGKEVYSFAEVDLSSFPGAAFVDSVLSVSIIFDDYRYTLPCYAFTEYQSKVRQYPYQYYYVPSISSQYGQGSAGSFYMYPLPSQTLQMEWDCLCEPQDMIDNLSVEVIPDTWADCVKFYAAKLTYESLQNFNSARYMEEQFDKQMGVSSRAARPAKRVNPYGRY